MFRGYFQGIIELLNLCTQCFLFCFVICQLQLWWYLPALELVLATFQAYILYNQKSSGRCGRFEILHQISGSLRLVFRNCGCCGRCYFCRCLTLLGLITWSGYKFLVSKFKMAAIFNQVKLTNKEKILETISIWSENHSTFVYSITVVF